YLVDPNPARELPQRNAQSGLPPCRGECRYRRGSALRRLWRIETTGGEFQHGFDLLTSHRKLLDVFVDGHAVFKVLKNDGNRSARILEHPGSANLARDAFNCCTLRPIECHRFAL